jgi:hypothetical protein
MQKQRRCYIAVLAPTITKKKYLDVFVDNISDTSDD